MKKQACSDKRCARSKKTLPEDCHCKRCHSELHPEVQIIPSNLELKYGNLVVAFA